MKWQNRADEGPVGIPIKEKLESSGNVLENKASVEGGTNWGVRVTVKFSFKAKLRSAGFSAERFERESKGETL